MINLLPPELKEAYGFAQRNSKLTRWAISFIAAIGGLLVIGAAGFLYMYQTSRSYDTRITRLEQELVNQDLKKTQKDTQDISNSMKLALQVLSKEVLFSKLLKQLASITPSNAVLTDLTISQVQGGLDITAVTTDHKTATQLQVNLADKENQIFSQADIVSITCSGGEGESAEAKYPCTVIIRALFAKDNPFLLIGDTKAATR